MKIYNQHISNQFQYYRSIIATTLLWLRIVHKEHLHKIMKN